MHLEYGKGEKKMYCNQVLYNKTLKLNERYFWLRTFMQRDQNVGMMRKDKYGWTQYIWDIAIK